MNQREESIMKIVQHGLEKETISVCPCVSYNLQLIHHSVAPLIFKDNGKCPQAPFLFPSTAPEYSGLQTTSHLNASGGKQPC